jgi:GntR family transcriptional regulator, transcriptional repressor for pyruvate dehydrogenase complex
LCMKNKLSYKPIKKLRLYEEVADQIKKTIFQGDLEPGDQLPSERDLAETFNVGRPTIREALRTLGVLGLIEINHGLKGSVVKKIDVGLYLHAMGDQFAWMIQADKKSFKEVWEARKYIELGIAHLVSQNASDKEIKDLTQFIGRMEACLGNVNKYFPIAIEFHLKLAELSRNKFLYMMWKLFYDINLSSPILKQMYPDQIPRLLEVNKLMLGAIQSKDPEKIDKAMIRHAEEELPIDLD